MLHNKCDGKRPVCTRCESQNIGCVYIASNTDATSTRAFEAHIAQLQQQLEEHADVLNRLRSTSQSEALVLLHKIRSSPNASSARSTNKGAAHSASRPSDLETARAILPPMRSDLQLELNMLHRSVYSVSMPLQLEGHELESLFSKTPLLSPSRSPKALDKSSSHGQHASLLRSTTPVHESVSADSDSDGDYCDARLKLLQLEFWTKVPIERQFAASVLSHHLRTYHPTFGCVDSNLFISDLVDHRLAFCSRFLVSAIFSFACVSVYSRSCSNLDIPDIGAD